MNEKQLIEQLRQLKNINENYNEIINDYITGLFHKVSLTSFSDITNTLLGQLQCAIEIKQDGGEFLTDSELEKTINSLKSYFSLLKEFDVFAGELLSDGYLPKSEVMNKKQYVYLSQNQYIEMLKILKEQ